MSGLNSVPPGRRPVCHSDSTTGGPVGVAAARGGGAPASIRSTRDDAADGRSSGDTDPVALDDVEVRGIQRMTPLRGAQRAARSARNSRSRTAAA